MSCSGVRCSSKFPRLDPNESESGFAHDLKKYFILNIFFSLRMIFLLCAPFLAADIILTVTNYTIWLRLPILHYLFFKSHFGILSMKWELFNYIWLSQLYSKSSPPLPPHKKAQYLILFRHFLLIFLKIWQRFCFLRMLNYLKLFLTVCSKS